ncbi:hypothetical protein N7492_005483 [Penicillium capsulatum]|uniref:NYN domain-containing protein n=1 Tax=Penicillium capsulatum TaxID=69766 RepID=A0A9W9I9N3_9EURO|nr:hypothetical protein N7492_005483 [Penicillium capsulatum]KAJ6135416.1 hypothetical protein N7512_000576 [Penicillium capsulatum]
MLATEYTDLASNWDFTPVLDLLRSPTRGGISHSADNAESDLLSKERSRPKYSAEYTMGNTTSSLTTKRSHTKLGDFDSLWELLGQDYDPGDNANSWGKPLNNSDNSSPFLDIYPSCTPRNLHEQDKSHTFHHHHSESHSSHAFISMSNPSKLCVTKDTVAGHSLRSVTQLPAVTILKRAAYIDSRRSDATCPLPPTSSGANKDSGYFLETPTSNPKVKGGVKGWKSKHKSQPTSAESGPETESEPTTNIFDQPISKKSGVLTFVPLQVGTSDARNQSDDTPPSSFDDQEPGFRPDVVKNIVNGSGPIQVQSSVYKSATERRVFLMTKLIRDFPEYAELTASRHSISFMQGIQPIHVFVDMSNIMVGFHDSVKVARNIPITTRIRRVHMSFANLSLIMERGRPAAKRVLVGSDRLPSIDEAESLGYEANILDRVHKVKHTSRPYKSRKPGSHMAPGKLEMASAVGERWVEQGVDEILHLKILESLIDTVEPATIVLATGDAAEAEYSGGFMCQVERVLQRGWTVELVSFSQVTSNAYRRKEFRSKWGRQFRLIELDAYVEELFF